MSTVSSQSKTNTGLSKKEQIAQVAQAAEVSNATAEKVVNSFVDLIKTQTKEDGRLAISGLGIFNLTHRPQREGRNPRTGETMVIKAQNAVRFSPSKAFKDSVNS